MQNFIQSEWNKGWMSEDMHDNAFLAFAKITQVFCATISIEKFKKLNFPVIRGEQGGILAFA